MHPLLKIILDPPLDSEVDKNINKAKIYESETSTVLMEKEECIEAQQSKLPVIGDFRKKSNTEKKGRTFAVNFGEICQG